MADNYEARTSSHYDNNATEFDDYFNEFDTGIGLGPDDEDDFLDIYNLSPRQRVVYQFRRTVNQFLSQYYALEPWQRILLAIGGGLIGILALLMLIFHNKILHKLVEMSNDLKEKWSTPIVLVTLIFFVAFPPMIGFSLLSTTTGLIYGISFKGWVILAIGAVTGSICSFALFKTILHSRAEKLIQMNRRFAAFASILQENNSYWILALLRLCPFPYSLTNGAVGAVYGVSIKNFAIGNIITTPKLLIYLFIGSRIKNMGETESSASKIFDLVSILLTVLALGLTAWVLYFKTQKRYQQLQDQSTINTSNDLDIDQNFEI
ncbi:hypothetical protein Kpol_1030p31 [Vanderwaltozyma polyspora DSM 70294]|uniref:Golgi apparatus membrane protein TVP38 n=1 Tax=Vanderwaltozyma polyspora (strain ATCC 22028 / DSM 70294 / BCRC 21397 / CBS 2163 / NBRC 10782 / NRRL Y-8283 / UCD 57-17) TaxID=436907 RepID=TVP38_VANPO|nr:uncharacterized protein Kpol_1030p31 [Vanderwaltozyma polyspora DSM 70294]A7TMU9.1 RecName: Full=Golgi apparatus membrane protein TVP38 [Vanderwaltozyma polyspora DSM 70294]EDO16421.1 hypothetical protein Kpol_1030p31 [Vanderwaltozyma polyspora DSM 70294]